MKFIAKGLVVVGALVGASVVGIEAASAMPIATDVASPAAPVEQVAWGCGPGWHPNPYGRCVPNGYGYGVGVVRPYGVYRGGYGVYRGGYGVHRYGYGVHRYRRW